MHFTLCVSDYVVETWGGDLQKGTVCIKERNVKVVVVECVCFLLAHLYCPS